MMEATTRGTAILFASLVAATAATAACGGAPNEAKQAAPSTKAAPTATVAVPRAGPSSPGSSGLELVESAPVETALNHPDIRDASEVWPEMISRAARTIDLAEFYASEADGPDLSTSRLTPVIAAVCAATARGVRVRLVVDASMAPKYPATLAALGACHVAMRTLDLRARTGGVLHAKYFIVDGHEAFLGSQNFDWRSLSQMQEIGVRVRSDEVARALSSVFEIDWQLAGSDADRSVAIAPFLAKDVTLSSGEVVSLLASPPGILPSDEIAELPRIVSLLDGAKRQASIQSLTYSTRIQHGKRKGETFDVLDQALRRAASRGVSVRVLVSSWATREEDGRRALSELAAVKNVSVRVITIPAFSGGEIPFARVAHSKYLVVDDHSAWVGTGNWEGDYFVQSRDVSLVVDSASFAAQLRGVFEDAWTSNLSAPYAGP